LISASVAGFWSVREAGLRRISFSIPGNENGPIFVVLVMASAEGFDRNQEEDRRSAKKALQP
jgi:hypothetical protein